MGIPAIQAAAKFHELRNLKKVMSSAGLGNLVRAAPRELVKGLRKASPETRKLVAKTFMDDLGRVQAEIERLGKLRSAVAGSNPEIAARLASRAKMLSNVAAEMEYRAPFFRQSGWDRTKRMAGLGLNTWWGGQSLYDAYKDAREGNYGGAAYHLAVAPMFGLGSVANHASRGLSIYGKSPKLAKALAAFGKLEHKMVAAGKYGTSGNSVTRWMMRHPFLTAEGLGTAVGAPTMLSTLTGGSGEDVQSGDIAADGGDLVNYGIPKNAGSRRDFSGLERRVDMYLQKEAASVLGRPETWGGAAAQTAAYMTPFLGSGLSIADGVNDLAHGRIWSGLGNLALGGISGVADVFSLGTAGTVMRGLAAGARGVRMAKGVATAARAGARGANMVARGYRGLRAGMGAAKTIGAGKAILGAQRVAQGMLGAKNYGRMLQMGGRVAQGARDFNTWAQGWRSFKPVVSAGNMVRSMPGYGAVTRMGAKGMAMAGRAPNWMKNVGNGVKNYGSFGMMFVPGMDHVFKGMAGMAPTMGARAINRMFWGDGSMMLPESYLDKGRAGNYEGSSLREMAGMGGSRTGANGFRPSGTGPGSDFTMDGAKTPGWQYRR